VIDKTDCITKIVNQLKNIERMNILVMVESDSANCSLDWAKDPMVFSNTASSALTCSWRQWDLLHSSE
jgi:hypothetical protein